MSSLIAHIDTAPFVLPATKSLPFGQKLNVAMSNKLLISAAMSPVPIS